MNKNMVLVQSFIKSRKVLIPCIQDTKTFQKYYVGRNCKRNQQKLHTRAWIAQDTMESKVPRLNVHTNQILAHTFSNDTIDSVVV